MSAAGAPPLRRAALGPVVVSTALTVLAAVVVAARFAWPAAVTGHGVVLAWLLLGLTAGYALSGSV